MLYKPLLWLFRAVAIIHSCTPSDLYLTGLALATIISAGLHLFLSVQTPWDLMESKLFNVSLLTLELTPIVFIVYSYLSRESYKRILADLRSVGNELKTETMQMQKIMFSMLTGYMVLMSVAFYSECGVFSLTISSMIVHLAFACPLIHHVVFVDLLASMFSVLNVRLENLDTEMNTTPLHTISTRINLVFRLHTHLLIMMLEVAIFVVQCLLCHACAKEANRTVLLAQQLLQPDTPAQLWEEVGLFSRLALKNKVHFSVGGIFSLDRCLLTKLAVTSLSYLIIAVQLKDVRPLWWLFRTGGIIPASSPSDLYFNALALALIISADLHLFLSVQTSWDSMENKLFNLSLITFVLTPIVFIVHTYLSREPYKRILADLNSVGNELKTETIRKQKIMFSMLIVCMAAISVAFYSECGVVSQTISSTIVHLAFACPLIHHVVFVDLLDSMFSTLNVRLEHLDTEMNTRPLHSISARMKSVFRLHPQLHIVLWKINKYFCFYNFLKVMNTLAFTISHVYEYLKTISEGNFDGRVEILVIMMVEVAIFVHLCLVCHACAKEANRTVLLAHHLLHPDTPAQLWEEVGLFSRLALNNKVHFSVGGIFSLDRPLLTKLAMTYLSYLIIAVQLKDVRLSGDTGASTNGTGFTIGNSTVFKT
ncbi:hypothetical protein J6590_091885 [Homalodisca vitripennis]|nr:hypothetical protein J6590_008878 [Homalodisca vitripennis]KAG8265582.1 hypothetical protein J6590_091885 [Homalodisca vitripennis]